MQSDELIQDFTEALIESGLRHGIEAALPARPAGGRWSGEAFIDVMQSVGRALDDAHFGLGCTRCPLQAQQFGVEVMLLSNTLGDALDRYRRFFQIASIRSGSSPSICGARWRAIRSTMAWPPVPMVKL